MWKNIKMKIMEVHEKFVPKRNTDDAPSWKSKYQFPLSSETRNAMKLKKRLYRWWISSSKAERTTQNWIDNILIRKDKRKFEQGIARDGKLKPKLFWSYAWRKLKTKVGVAPLLSDLKNKESLVFNDKEKADLTKESLHDIPSFYVRSQIKLGTIVIQVEDIVKKLKGLNTNKSWWNTSKADIGASWNPKRTTDNISQFVTTKWTDSKEMKNSSHFSSL